MPVVLEDIITPEGRSINALLRRMSLGAAGILLVVDAQGRLTRTVTDGDLRRALLSGADQSALAIFPEQTPVTAPYDAADNALLEIMDASRVEHVPLLDDAGRPVDLRMRRDIRAPLLLSPPHLGEAEAGFVQEAFQSNWIAPAGPHIDAFERDLAARVGAGHALAVSSGTAALHLAAILCGVERGDLVFCSSLTFVASVNPVLYQGAEPVFIDSEPESWNMSPRALETAFAHYAKQGRKPKAVIVTDLYGQSARMDAICAICETHGVDVIEDAAEALGATYRARAAGTFGRFGVYSFNGNKIITTSGGGALISDDAEAIAHAGKLSTQAREPAPWYQHTERGYNYRMSNLLAGVGRGQLGVLDERVAARRAIFAQYRAALADVEGVELMPELDQGAGTRWLTTLMLEPAHHAIDAPNLVRMMNGRNIEVRHVWKPMHRQPLFTDCAYFPHDEDMSFCDRAFDTGVCLPSGSGMSAAAVARVCDAMMGAMSSARRVRGVA